MVLTAQEVEDKLVALEKANKELKMSLPRHGNPFESVEFQLSLEGGHTVSARTRKLPMACDTPRASSSAEVSLVDAATEDVRASIPVPSDWVVGTDITVHITVYKTGASGELAVLRSFISSQGDTETRSFNVEDDQNINTTIPASSELEEIKRTISSSKIAAGDNIKWVFQRLGGDGSDVLGETLLIQFQPWIEYKAFF